MLKYEIVVQVRCSSCLTSQPVTPPLMPWEQSCIDVLPSILVHLPSGGQWHIWDVSPPPPAAVFTGVLAISQSPSSGAKASGWLSLPLPRAPSLLSAGLTCHARITEQLDNFSADKTPAPNLHRVNLDFPACLLPAWSTSDVSFLTLYMVLDTGYHYFVIWNKCCFSLSLNATSQ